MVMHVLCNWVNLKDSVCTTDNITFVIYYIFTTKTVLVYQKKKNKIPLQYINLSLEDKNGVQFMW